MAENMTDFPASPYSPLWQRALLPLARPELSIAPKSNISQQLCVLDTGVKSLRKTQSYCQWNAQRMIKSFVSILANGNFHCLSSHHASLLVYGIKAYAPRSMFDILYVLTPPPPQPPTNKPYICENKSTKSKRDGNFKNFIKFSSIFRLKVLAGKQSWYKYHIARLYITLF